jgi:alpha-N-acetylglucosaminidase
MNYNKWPIFLMLALSGQCAFAQLDKSSLDAFLHRVVKDKAGEFEIAFVASENGKDVFELDGKGPKIVLRGSNGISVASALNYYLKNYCHHLVTWNGAPQPLPAVLPPVRKKVHRTTPYQYRYYLNYCTFQYSMAWWDWERWQQEIDWMALNGINMPLALTGEEAIWQEVYRNMGFTDQELDRFYSGPAYFSWLWMGNIDAWGGPLPAHWKESHLLLQKKILAAERAFGMKPVLGSFTGHVPPSFKDRFPLAKVKKTNWDAGFDDVYILDPSDSLFEVVGRKFIEAQTRVFGTDHFYSADTFNENVPPTSDSTYLDGMSKKVYASMAGADPKAVWVMQGWMFHYNAAYWKPTQIQALLNAVPDDHMILLDLYSESHPVWNRTEASGAAKSGSSEGQTLEVQQDRATLTTKTGPVAYYGKPWIWNMLHNFGGNISLWGRMRHAAEDPSKAFHDPSAGKMIGIGLTPEGIEQNPALYQLMLENVWQDSAVDLRAWLDNYTQQRYGVADGEIRMAWHLLESSVYNGGLTEGGPESIIQARPTFDSAIDRVNTRLDYDPGVLQGAWSLFVNAAPKLKNSDGFRYDLVDVTRQVLANYASVVQQRFVRAWKEKDTAGFRRSSRQFLALMDDMDRLLATRKDFLLGRWIKEARACGVTPAESDLYEKNARDLVTLWGDKESGLREYSCRQWSGLIKGFYKPRWELFFRRLDAALSSGQAMDFKNFDAEVKNWEWQWVNDHDKYAEVVHGDAIEIATALYKKYHALMQEPVASNDGIFPADGVAKPFIDFDSKGFLINGKRTFLVSAGLEYARIPHELWRDRLLRLKRAGFNCIEIYTFWNWHEPQEGKFTFSGDHDLGAFLRLVGNMGLYAIVRVGPYYCAEWDNGGYPLWLRFKNGVRVREDNAAFEQYVDRFFDKLLPVVFSQQIQKGGPVIMVQLENEHPRGWGTYMPDGYFRHLQQKALSMGLKVPYFFSGLHHSSDPAGDLPEERSLSGPQTVSGNEAVVDPARLDDPARNNPWMSTEFWSVWYNGYGSGEKEAKEYARRTWKIIAHGGNGYNYYMAHGGSNFGYTNNDEDAASYDYGAAVGQAGDLRPIYYSFRKAAWFARSMQEILENSEDATEEWKSACEDTVLRVTARRSPAGELLFADNPSVDVRPLQIKIGEGRMLPEQGPLDVSPGEILPVLHDIPIVPGIRLDWGPVRLLGISKQGNVTTLVIYGEIASPAELYFSVEGKVVSDDKRLLIGDRKITLREGFRDLDVPSLYSFAVGGQKVRIIAVCNEKIDRVWLVDKGTIYGADYVGEIKGWGENINFLGEMLWEGEGIGPALLYDTMGEHRIHHDNLMPPHKEIAVLPLRNWYMKRWAAPAGMAFDDHSWLWSRQPLQMGSDRDGTADAWYRSKVNVGESGNYVLQVEGGDRATVFVDSKPVTRVNLHDGEIPLTLSKGQHVLAIFTAHDGRDKLAGFLGDMHDVDSKGLTGKVTLVKGPSLKHTIEGWQVSRNGKEDWKDYAIGQDVFNKRQGEAWFRAVLPEPPAGITKGQLIFRSVDENATVYLNRRKLASHEGWNIPFKVSLEGLDTMKRPLELTIFIENYSNEGGIDQPVKVNYLTQAAGVTGWRMRGGVDNTPSLIGADAGWTSGAVQGGRAPEDTMTPCFYKANFDAPAYSAVGDHLIWRVVTKGLGHGSVWVNGHNLGRYPEKIPAPGLYIPECWMKSRDNVLIIFDEDGKSPAQVAIDSEPAASRELFHYVNGQ